MQTRVPGQQGRSCPRATGEQLTPGGHMQHLQEPRNDPRSGFLFSAGSFAASGGGLTTALEPKLR